MRIHAFKKPSGRLSNNLKASESSLIRKLCIYKTDGSSAPRSIHAAVYVCLGLRFAQPTVQFFVPAWGRTLPPSGCIPEFACVGTIVALVAWPQILKFILRLTPVQVPNHVHELKQANRLIRDPRHLRAREQECVDQIIDVENITHLLPSPQSVIVCPSRARIRKCATQP